ncbi:MAG: hypothetical protein AABY06_00110, partial [Nanoarchaeota archaeon]
MKTLKNILLATTFGISFGLNSGYSQGNKEYYVGDPTYSEEGIKKVDKETFWKIAKENNHYSSGMEEQVDKSNLTKWYVIPGDDKKGGFRSTASESVPKTTQSYKSGSYQATPTKQVEFKSSTQPTPSQNKQTPGRNINWSTPSNTNKNSELGKAILTTGAIVGGILILNEILKPRNKAPVYNSSPANNSPVNYKSTSGESNIDWWKEDNKKSEKIIETKKNNKNSEGNWWSDSQQKEAEKIPMNENLHKTAEVVKNKIAKNLPEGELMLEADKEFYEFMKDKDGKNYWEEGYSGSQQNIKILIDDEIEKEIKKAEEFDKEYNSRIRQPKEEDTLRIGNYKFNKIGTINYPERNKPEKIVIYEVYKAVKYFNLYGMGTVINGFETAHEIEKKGINNWWDEIKEKGEEDYGG